MIREDSKILVVDDQESVAKIISDFLTINGFESMICTDPFKVSDILEQEKISLILLDYYMPEKNGIEVLTETRKKYSPLELPIIVITGSDDDAKVIKVLKNNGNDYITKPLNFDITLARIKTQLSLNYYHKELLKAQELKTITSMIITYNHEINTPLNIAYNSADEINEKLLESPTPKVAKKLIRALDSIKDITDKIEKLKHKKPEYIPYTKKTKIFKL